MNVRKSLFSILLGACSCLSATAATLCVNSTGAFPCYMHIADAVNAAAPGDVIQVGAGTYNESVTITKPVSITTQSAILDATGLSRGFFINGLNKSNLSKINISGFTVRNANFEGILVLNAGQVTLSNNMVMGNNKALSGGTCPHLDGFETNEASDCGEGIHLLGAHHSVVMNNTVQNNSGGILLSDDTAATHDNLISFNMVQNNPYACGITMASHPAYAPGPVTADAASGSYGVFHNTVYANRSRANGLANGGGAGVGIFASVPGAKSYGNVVVANYLTDNGLPGVAMHSHAPDQKLSDNLITGNTLVNNGADTQDAYTPGPTGINLYSLTPQGGNMFVDNQVQSESVDVAINVPENVQVHFNSLLGNGIGVANLGPGPVNATENYWSCPGGPGNTGSCSTVFGPDVLSGAWLTAALPTLPNF